MAFIIVKAKKLDIDEELLLHNIVPNKENYFWTECAIRTEDIKNYYAITEKTLFVTFYEDESPLIVRETVQDFTKRIIELEACQDEIEE